jgi:tRNA nucleotidyltransferase/poly(A) polymerase
MATNFKNFSDEKLDAEIDKLQKELNRRRALATLVDHDEVNKIHQAIKQAAKATGTSEVDVRIAEAKKFIDDLPAFYVELARTIEQWKNEHATYRNPDDPEQYWYAPDASGNPPKWVKDALGGKPDREKEPKQYEAWVKKLEKYRVNRKGTNKEAA